MDMWNCIAGAIQIGIVTQSTYVTLCLAKPQNSAINSCGAAHGDSGWWCVAVQHRVRHATNINNTCAKAAEKKVIQLIWFT